MAASRTVEPIAAVFTLLFGKARFFLTLGTLAIHLAIFNIVSEQQTTARTGFGIALTNFCPAIGLRTDKDRLTGTTPVFTFFFFFADGTFIHNSSLSFQKLQ